MSTNSDFLSTLKRLKLGLKILWKKEKATIILFSIGFLIFISFLYFMTYIESQIPEQEKQRRIQMIQILQEAEPDDYLVFKNNRCARIIGKGAYITYRDYDGAPFTEINPSIAANHVVRLIKAEDPDYQRAMQAYLQQKFLHQIPTQ